MPVYIQIAVPQRVLDSVRPKGEPSTVAGCVQDRVITLIEPFPQDGVQPPKDFKFDDRCLYQLTYKAHAYQCSQGHQTWVWLVDGEAREVDCSICHSAYLSALKRLDIGNRSA